MSAVSETPTGPELPTGPDDASPATSTTGLWIGLVLGSPLLAYGARGVLADLPDVQLTSFLQWFVGGAVLHDLVIGPLVCLVAWLVVRRVPAIARAPVQGALVASAITVVVAWPFIRAYGITEGEPSFLSRNYSASVLILWAFYWSIAALVVCWRLQRRLPA